MISSSVSRYSKAGLQSKSSLFLYAAFIVAGLVVAAMPVLAVSTKSFQNDRGEFIGLVNFAAYFGNPSLVQSIVNSLFIGVLTTVITVGFALVYAYALSRSHVPLKWMFRALATVPILAPSLLPAIALTYMFGNQGYLTWMLQGNSIYGPIGIVIAQVFFCFPYAFLVLTTALEFSDARLYESARMLGASPFKMFRTITLPSIKYGLVSAFFVVFTISLTDFGVVKVVGGQTNVLALDIYKQVLGQQNFEMGAVVSVLLLVPCVISYFADYVARRRQQSMLSARSAIYRPPRSVRLDVVMFVILCLLASFILTVLGTAVFASIVSFWPYDLTLTLDNYAFSTFDPAGWQVYFNTLVLATLTMIVGTAATFMGAYLSVKTSAPSSLGSIYRVLGMMPMAVPGLALGLGYIFVFNSPSNPLNFIYGGMTIMVINTVVHYYTLPHLMAMTALQQLDKEFEEASRALGVAWWKTLLRLTVPICTPTIMRIAGFYFISAMTTVGAVIFLYAPHTKLASVAVVAMDDTGDTAPAAALCIVIMATCCAFSLLQTIASFALRRVTSGWRAG